MAPRRSVRTRGGAPAHSEGHPRRASRPGAERGALPSTREAERVLLQAFAEDRARHDRTSRSLLPAGRLGLAYVLAERRGVVSGVRAAVAGTRWTGLRVRALVRDGTLVRPGQRVLALSGELRTILAVERSVLNLLMHLSGVATETRRAVRAAHGAFEIFGTRKTLPGLRRLEKDALVHGGARPHRMDLASGLLVKTTHLAWVPIPEAVERLRRAYGQRWPIEVEVRTVREAQAATRAGADALLVDNATPARARSIVRAVRARSGDRPRWIELSGGLTVRALGRYRRTDADAASLGALTHSAPALPFHLRFAGEELPRGTRPRAHPRR